VRAAGAAVILLGHTADDVAESDLIRAEGTPIGQLREWAPSPAWPEGRGLMLLRPLLDERRAALRDLLRARGLDWIEDPANEDLRFARSRARAALRGADAGSASDAAEVQRPWNWRALWSGTFEVDREMSPAFLAALALSAAGTDRPPRGERVQRLRNRLAAPGDFHATLAGAAFTTWRDLALVGREPGRKGLPSLRLEAGRPQVWDGRFQITAAASVVVAPAGGLRNMLPEEDRAVTRRVRQGDAAALPVLVRDDGSAPVLAWRDAEVVTLAPRRLSLAAGETTHERELSQSVDGERPPADLF
ncbi:MAG: PP-loop family protein, partial [Alphaproteobacteria bacterium]|nr:PP-loop family protein [Alphaproteobacteria bacterium]